MGSPKQTIYSLGGNISFPGWEYFIPKVGIFSARSPQ